MEQRVIISRQGPPEVVTFESVDLLPPVRDEVRMRHTAIGMNFIDVGQRRGSYPVTLPAGLGVEAAGIVESVGPDVTAFKPGDRVCTFGPTPGTYATARNVPADLLFHTPDDISDDVAAATLLKGCTAEFLVERCAKVEAGQTVLVHAAAGGVGLLLAQWLKHVGATVVGTVSTDAKAEIAQAAGADHVVRYDRDDATTRILELTGGDGVHVTIDGVGAATWEMSLAVTGRRGLIVNYGISSASVDTINPIVLMLRGSLFNARPALYDYYVTPEERKAGTERVFDLLRQGVLTPHIGQKYALKDAARALSDLEGRRTTGSGLLIP